MNSGDPLLSWVYIFEWSGMARESIFCIGCGKHHCVCAKPDHTKWMLEDGFDYKVQSAADLGLPKNWSLVAMEVQLALMHHDSYL